MGENHIWSLLWWLTVQVWNWNLKLKSGFAPWSRAQPGKFSWRGKPVCRTQVTWQIVSSFWRQVLRQRWCSLWEKHCKTLQGCWDWSPKMRNALQVHTLEVEVCALFCWLPEAVRVLVRQRLRSPVYKVVTHTHTCDTGAFQFHCFGVKGLSCWPTSFLQQPPLLPHICLARKACTF